MNPLQDPVAHRLCRLLDSATDDLSPRIQSCLAAARHRALLRLDELTLSGCRPRPQRTWWPHAPWSRLALAAIPAIFLVLTALAGSLFNQERAAIQQADAYTEMLTADVPLSAYTDNGFAAHLQDGMLRTAAASAR
ncbi:MAG: DUF3619 family protein [Lautropia sp.]|nr:DUF3619 family protein [Lautropia sp.]